MTDRNSPEGLLLVNISGVFNDLDDGGITEEEALDQIRDIIERATPDEEES